MKRIVLLLHLLGCAGLAGAFPVQEKGVYRVEGPVDLKGATVTLERGTTLDLTRGSLHHGKVVGNESRLAVSGDDAVLDGVILEGSWCGNVEDRWFSLEGNSAYWIVSNVFKFNEVTFYRDAYWLETWIPILINRDWMKVHGNDVRLYLPSDKGESKKSRWGAAFRKECLFSNPVREGPGESFLFEDIHIEDNADVIGKPGWGQDMKAFYIYNYFQVIGHEVVFRNVSSDGMGSLEKVYNLWQPIDRIEMDRCSVRAGQFALEVCNLDQKGYPGGTCGEILVHGCEFYQYPCQPYVGLLSVVGEKPTEEMLVENCVFDATEKDGNLELSSVQHIVLRNNTMVNQFVNSYPLAMIERYDILENTFHFRKRRSGDSFSFGGREIEFKDNRLVYEDEDVGFITFSPTIRSLEMVRNTFDFSAVRTMTGHRTALALSGFSLSGGKLRMVRNKVVPPSARGSHRFIFRLPERMESSVGNRFQGVLVQ